MELRGVRFACIIIAVILFVGYSSVFIVSPRLSRSSSMLANATKSFFHSNKLPQASNSTQSPSLNLLCNIMTVKVNTSLGMKNYVEILRDVYEPFGYEYAPSVMDAKCFTEAMLLPLRSKALICSHVFEDWLMVQIKSNITINSTAVPPKQIPEHLRSTYLLNNHSWLDRYYFDETPAHLPKSRFWTTDMIDKYTKNYQKLQFGFLTYGDECAAVFHAFGHFNVTNQTGMVIGSLSPWLEAMALYHGAVKVITAEYFPINIQVSNMEYVHAIHLVKNWQQYGEMDFVASFSSIEHSGLGRFGDPLDPIGDLREVNKIWCLLKSGGLLYLGLPSGPDQVVYNAHRIYGYLRWPMIAANFRFRGAFYGNNTVMYETLPPMPLTGHKQLLFVLQKL